MSDLVHETASVILFARFGTGWRLCLISDPRTGGQFAPEAHVEEGELPQTAGIRAVRESTGLSARLLLPPADCPQRGVPAAWHITDLPAAADGRCPHRHREHIVVGVADRPFSCATDPEHAVHWIQATDLQDLESPHSTLAMGHALFQAIESAAALQHPPEHHEQIATELLQRQDTDQALRKLPAARRPCDWTASVDRVDADNTARLRDIIAVHGWPGHALVGPPAAAAAWLIAQHADRDPAFQRTCLDLLSASVTAGDADARHGALLEDRVLIAQGQPQIFGTQLTRGPSGTLTPYPLRNPAEVEALRAAWGFEPLETYIAQVADTLS
ncbi:DUF6624 domain-containing protein [Streptomyces sp. NPDC059718]